MFEGKKILITGGTGSFGNTVLKRFLNTSISEIRIFSRDEKKQDDMRKKYKSNKLKFYIGNVREKSTIRDAVRDVDYIFHAAALKQVPACEFFPIEAVKTNVLGTENVLNCAIDAGVKKVVCLSTDKAAYPINAMGISKAMMEKIFVAKSRTVQPETTTICGTRYGNVMASRGSVIPLFVQQIKAGQPLTVTDGNMTRFLMSLDEAVELVLYAYTNANSGDILVQKSPACTVFTLAQALTEIFDVKSPIKTIGFRHGEKLYETLLTKEEYAKAEDLGNYYRIPIDERDLNYENFEAGGTEGAEGEYNSNITYRLNVEETKERLLKLPFIKRELAGTDREGYFYEEG